jgi:SNF2 family DNA or RNA helicase
VGANDHDGVPYRTMEWLKRFRNIFTQLVTSSMMRHEKNLLFRGRATLLVLPKTRVEVIRVQLTEVQRAAYKLLYEFAKKRFEAFKASGDAVRKTIEILQLLVPLRQACSAATVDIDVVKQQLKDLAAGIAVGGPAVGVASAPSESYPQAVLTAFGTLADECSICLELLEDAVQTQCRHLFCKASATARTRARTMRSAAAAKR